MMRSSAAADAPHGGVSAAPAIELWAVAQRLGASWALRGVTLTVGAGEIVAVVGHNGSGKTTILRVLSTLLRPTRGDGRVMGHDLRREADAVRGVVGLLAHRSGLYDELTAAENLVFAQRMLGQRSDRAAVERVLAEVGLARVADDRVRTFSSGMQRRVAIARLLLRRPPLLLLDEPYNSLDAEGVTVIDRLLAETRARGGAALVVLHDLARCTIAVDRVVEMREGRLCGEAATAVTPAADAPIEQLALAGGA